MPVWHNATRKWRESGDLAVVGITQEQHPARCRLFAQWQGIDWPILWDPFNTTGSKVVPNFILIDEHGVVRSRRARMDTIEAEFIKKAFEAPPDLAAPPNDETLSLEYLSPLEMTQSRDAVHQHLRAMSDLLWGRAEDPAVADGVRWGAGPRLFQYGVALRMRYDSKHRQSGDFQAAVDAWTKALAEDPQQYIWRRRIQQYGPRLDKPYPFYDWVAKAQAEIEKRGGTPVGLDVGLTESELAGKGEASRGPAVEPDPDKKIESGPDPVHVESSIAPATGKGQTTVRVHLVLRPKADAHVDWDLEAGAPYVWIAGQLLEAKNAATIARDGGVRFEFEHEGTGTLSGYALYYACLSESGACRYLRHDFDVAIGAK